MITEGAQVVVGDTVPVATEPFASEPVVAYEVLCRDHHRRGITRSVARSSVTDPLPFERTGDEREDELL